MGHTLREMTDMTGSDKRFEEWLSLKKKIDSMPASQFTVGELRFLVQKLKDHNTADMSEEMIRLRKLAHKLAGGKPRK